MTTEETKTFMLKPWLKSNKGAFLGVNFLDY